MFGFSRRRMKLGRLKIQLADSTQGMRSPIRHPKRFSHSNGESVVSASNHSLEMRSDDLNCHSSLSGLDLNICTSGNSENWMPLSTIGDRPAPCFNHAATVIGSKMVVVGGESGNGLLDDVQVLNFNKLTWTVIRAAPKAYLSPTTLPPKIPPCKGHCLVSWGKQALLIGGKTEPVCDKVSVWAFDVDTECWSHLEARGDIPVPPQLNLRSLKQFLGFHSENLGLWSKVARSGHTVTRAGSVLILFGGEDAKGRKLNDLHMFDLKSLMWLPLHYTGTGPSPRSNHVATLYDDRVLFIFGGASKSRTLNDLYTLDFETMIWSRIKPRGLNPSPRAGCHGVLCGAKWYITGGGSRKKRHAETLMFDVLKVEWSVAVTSPPSSVTTNKGFSLVLVQHKEKVCLVAFGGNKKELSNQAEYLIVEQSVCQRSSPDKDSLLVDKRNTIDFTTQLNNCAPSYSVDAAARQNLASMQEFRCSNRKSLSESSCVDQSSVCGNVLLHKQFHQEEEYNSTLQVQKNLEDDKESDDCSILNSTSSQVMEQKSKSLDPGIQMDVAGSLANAEESPFIFGLENSRNFQKQVTRHPQPDNDDLLLPEIDGKSVSFTAPANIYQLYETKLAALLRKNGLLEGQLAAALASREALEKNLSAVLKSRHDMDKKLTDTVNEMELLKEKLAAAEIAQEEANSLSNIVHSDNVRLEHDVAFLKAVLDDTQKELHSTRGVLAGEKARTFQLQVEVFHLKQRLQSIEYRAPTPRKPFHV